MKSPFKFLDAYRQEDRDIFFGRDREIEQLYRDSFKTDLLLVYGQSGTGKTSLIQCGLANRFRNTDWFEVYIRRGENINQSLRRELDEEAQTPIDKEASVPEAVQSLYLDFLKPVYLIFDQFEELFILGSREEQQEFFRTVAQLTDGAGPGGNKRVSCKLIFVMREEYIAWLNRFEKIVPRLFENRVRVEPMKLSNIEDVIKKSAHAFKIRLDSPDDTVQHIIENNKDQKGTVHLPYLQVYLDRLYRRAARTGGGEGGEGEVVFNTPLVDRVGKIGDVMVSFLNRQTGRIQRALNRKHPDAPSDFVWRLLGQFVSIEGTNTPIRKDIIYDKFPGQEEYLDFCLERLEQVRLLRITDEDNTYEITHDALVRNIAQRRSVEETTLLKAGKLINDRFAAHDDTGVLLTQSELHFIAPFEERLKSRITADEFQFLDKSKRKASKRKTIIAFTTAALILIVFLGVFSFMQWRKAARIATSLRLLSTAAGLVNADPTATLRIVERIRTREAKGEEDKKVTKFLRSVYLENNFYKNLVKYKGERHSVQCVAYSPERRYILFGLLDGKVKLYNLEGEETGAFKHDGAVTGAVFSPGGEYVLTGSMDHKARLWNLENNEIVIFPHAAGVTSVALSPGGTYVLTGCMDSTARLWDLRGNLKKEFKGHNAAVNAVVFSPDGLHVLTGSFDNSARLWDLEGNEQKKYMHEGTVESVAFSHDGKLVLTVSADNTARLWDRNIDREEKAILKGHDSIAKAGVFSSDDRFILTGSYDGTARLWDLNGKQLQVFKGHTGWVNFVSYDAASEYILTGSSDNTFRKWRLKSIPLLEFNCIDKIESVAFSYDGNLIATGSHGGWVRIGNMKGDMAYPGVKHDSGIETVTFSPDGKSILFGSVDNTARLYDLEGVEKAVFQHDGTVESAAFSPDGKYILTGSVDGIAWLWDYDGEKWVNRIRLQHDRGIESVTFSKDGKYILTGSYDRTARVWDVDGKIKLVIDAEVSNVNAVAISPDNKFILTGLGNGDAVMWDWNKNKLLVLDHEGSVEAVAFSPDGKFILTGSKDFTVRLWDLEGNRLQQFRHNGSVESAVFSPDGKYILTGSGDHTARIWKNQYTPLEEFLESDWCQTFSEDELNNYIIK